MGKSPSIKNLSETDQEFTQFMEEMSKNVKQTADGLMGEFTAAVKSFYNDANGKYIQLAAKEHEDYQLETEFSMEAIGKVIEKIGKEVFETPSVDAEKQKAMAALGEYTGMAVKLAVSFLSNAMSALAWKESASYSHDIQHVSVGPGLTLHLLLVNRVYEGRGVIKSKKVFQNFVIYQLNFCAVKAAAEADVLYLQSRLDTIASNTATYTAIQNAMVKLITGPEFAAEELGGRLHQLASTYQSLMDQLSAAQTNAYNEIHALLTRQKQADRVASSTDTQGSLDAAELAPNAPLLAYLKEAL